MAVTQLLKQIPIPAETLIIALRICGISAILLAVALFARGIVLTNALSVAKAQRILSEQYRSDDTNTSPIMLHQIEEESQTQEKVKKPLVVFTLPPEAQDLLSKIATKPICEDGWCVNPPTEP